MAKSGLTISHAALFFASTGFNLLLAAITYVMLRRRGEESFVEHPDTADDLVSWQVFGVASSAIGSVRRAPRPSVHSKVEAIL